MHCFDYLYGVNSFIWYQLEKLSDTVFQCVGSFEGEDVTHVEGDVNPVRDLEIISEELRKKVTGAKNHSYPFRRLSVSFRGVFGNP